MARYIPPETIISPHNYDEVVLSKDGLRDIANLVSQKTGKKMLQSQLSTLVNFIANLSGNRFYGKTYPVIINHIANDFIHRAPVRQEQYAPDNVNLHSYEKEELFQFTENENQFKFAAFADRRGNSVIDRERVEGKRGSPNDLLSAQASKDPYVVSQEVYKLAKVVQAFLEPASINEIFTRVQSTATNYDNIALVPQFVPLDSRNRDPTSLRYTWNIHNAASVGSLGNIKLQDTIQQVKRIMLYPFWMPYNATIAYYKKVRIFIQEFNSQSIMTAEFNDASQNIPSLEHFHFELDVDDQDLDRLHLVPRQDTFDLRLPQAQLNSITISFRTPYQELILDPDSGRYLVTFGTPTLFTITSAPAHLLNTGDLIYVYNSQYAPINSSEGYYITKTSSTDFTIPVDSSTIPGTQSEVLVYYGSKRIFFQLKFLCLEQ